MTPTLAVDVLPDIRATLDAASAALWTIARSSFPESADAAKEEIDNALAALAALESRRCATCRWAQEPGLAGNWLRCDRQNENCEAMLTWGGAALLVRPDFSCAEWTAAEAEGVTK